MHKITMINRKKKEKDRMKRKMVREPNKNHGACMT